VVYGTGLRNVVLAMSVSFTPSSGSAAVFTRRRLVLPKHHCRKSTTTAVPDMAELMLPITMIIFSNAVQGPAAKKPELGGAATVTVCVIV
jgi:hypothetical protein